MKAIKHCEDVANIPIIFEVALHDIALLYEGEIYFVERGFPNISLFSERL